MDECVADERGTESADGDLVVPTGSGVLTAVARCIDETWELRAATNVRVSTPPS